MYGASIWKKQPPNSHLLINLIEKSNGEYLPRSKSVYRRGGKSSWWGTPPNKKKTAARFQNKVKKKQNREIHGACWEYEKLPRRLKRDSRNEKSRGKKKKNGETRSH